MLHPGGGAAVARDHCEVQFNGSESRRPDAATEYPQLPLIVKSGIGFGAGDRVGRAAFQCLRNFAQKSEHITDG